MASLKILTLESKALKGAEWHRKGDYIEIIPESNPLINDYGKIVLDANGWERFIEEIETVLNQMGMNRQEQGATND